VISGQGRRSTPRWSRQNAGALSPRMRIVITGELSQAFVDGQALAHLSPRAEHRLAKKLGPRAMRRAAPCVWRFISGDRRDGLSIGVDRAELGFLRRAGSRASRSVSSVLYGAYVNGEVTVLVSRSPHHNGEREILVPFAETWAVRSRD